MTRPLRAERARYIHDNDTHGHSQRAAELIIRIAQHLGILDDMLVQIRRGAPVTS